MTVTLRGVKGSPLTEAEMDANFSDLRDGIGSRTPNTRVGTGIKIWDGTTEADGWHDIHGSMQFDASDPNTPAYGAYRGGIRQLQFGTNDQLTVVFHIPHDYRMGTDLFIHAHWSHNSSTLTGGSVTWGFEVSYAKGFDQEAFTTPVTTSVLQNANTTQYQHMVAEGAVSVAGGSGTQLNTNDIEVDGVILCRFYIDSNDLTDSSAVPDPFVHFVDLHYNSTSVPTKNRNPDFWT